MFVLQCRSVLAIVISIALVACADNETPLQPVKLKISKETTYVDGPMRSNGLIDYVQAYENICAEGVTSDNNAAVLLAQAYGPAMFSDEQYMLRVFSKLGVAVPEGDCIVGDWDLIAVICDADGFRRDNPRRARHVESWLHALPEGITEEAHTRFSSREEFEKEAEMQFGLALQKPWRAEDYSIVDAWLRINEKPLALVERAVQRSHYFFPIDARPNGEVFAQTLLPALGRHRVVVRLLAARAMFKLQRGDRDGAWHDLRTAYRLPSLIAEPMLIPDLVAVSIEALLAESLKVLVIEGNLSEAQLWRILNDYGQIRPRPPIQRALSTAERFAMLDELTTFKNSGLEGVRGNIEGAGTLNEAQASQIEILLDPNYVLRELNRLFDDLIRACELDTYARRTAAYDVFDRRIMAAADRLSEWMKSRDRNMTSVLLARAMEQPIGERRERFNKDLVDCLIYLALPALSAAPRNDELARMNFELTRVTLALAVYRARHGRYPAALSDLSPEILKHVPLDRFSGQPLHYRTDGDGYLLYSVSKNMKDDGGTFRTEAEPTFADVAVHVENGRFVDRESR